MLNLDNYSFLDIQYVWFNNNQTVLFIKDEMFNNDNLDLFKQLNNNNIFIAHAIEGNDVFITKDIESNLALYEHGYYDLLLKDYEILPYKRKYYASKLPNKMSLIEIKEKFAYNERRLKLYDDLIKVITIINKCIKLKSIMIGGSYLEDKEYPNDLDLLIIIDKENYEIIKDNEKLFKLYRILTMKHLMVKAHYDIHANVLIEEDIDLNNCSFNDHNKTTTYLCNRGYYIALFNQKTIKNNDNYDCYIRNIVTIKL